MKMTNFKNYCPRDITYISSKFGRLRDTTLKVFEIGWTMTRRLSACRALLIGGACLIMLIASHRLAGSASLQRVTGQLLQPEPPVATVHANISTNEIGTDDASELDAENTAFLTNRSQYIQEVIDDQRDQIAQEMEGYTYPNGRYNVSARKLQDLVPELGGHPLRTIVITTWRSGSTFLGDVLNSHPANFYHYEPLLDYDIIQIRSGPLASEAILNLKALLNCNYTGMSHYLNYGKHHNWLFSHNTRLWIQCQQHPEICWLPDFLSPFCRLFPFQSMKVVRLRLKLAEELLNDPSLNVRMLLLVRDPRGTLQSRKHRDWCPGNPDCSEASHLCADLSSDFSAAVHLNKKYPDRFRVMRYEDLSVEPFMGVQDLFQFFGLDFHPSVQEFLDTHTKMDVGGVSSTYRNSKSAPFHWRQDLTHQEVRNIQHVCAQAMEHWGYLNAINSTHQHDFNPMGPFSLT